jgi:hypothetical protein
LRRAHPHSLWLGHAGDGRDLRGILDAGIAAVVQLAVEEPPITATRELVVCRFPLIDGSGNPVWMLQAAIAAVERCLRNSIPTLLCCGAGMSRSPAIAAAALAGVSGGSPANCLVRLAEGGRIDVSPALWHDVCHVVAVSSEDACSRAKGDSRSAETTSSAELRP